MFNGALTTKWSLAPVCLVCHMGPWGQGYSVGNRVFGTIGLGWKYSCGF